MTIEIKQRSFRVEIETPPADDAKSVAYHREALIYEDGEVIGKAAEQPQAIRYRFVDEAATMVTFTDPVTSEEHTVSLAGIAEAIRTDYDTRAAAELEEPEV